MVDPVPQIHVFMTEILGSQYIRSIVIEYIIGIAIAILLNGITMQ